MSWRKARPSRSATDLAKEYGLNVNKVPVTNVGASWGSQVTTKAIEALIAFLIVIVIYLSIAFEWRMAAAALVALAHDIVITIGVYALTGFQVSPATVIGLLTILGYSLYDTVVVFDKVRENTAPILGTRKSTYSEAANLALNQTLVRSINTSLTALLPVAAILIVGSLLLGNGELKDLSLVLFVGMLSGTYSSIFIATPVLADLKEREPQYKQLARQVALRAAGGRAALRKAKAATAGATATSVASANGGTGATAVEISADTDAVDSDELIEDDSVPDDAAGDRTARRSDRPAGRRAPAAGPQVVSKTPAQRQEEAAVASRMTAAAGGGADDIVGLLTSLIRDVPDYPKPGIVFKDITPLLADGPAFAAVIRAMAAGSEGVTKVAGHRGQRDSSWPPRSPASSGLASCRSASRASCQPGPMPSRMSSSTAPRR